MMYSLKLDKDVAKAYGIGLPISLKQSVEVCSFIRNKKYDFAVRHLENVTAMKAIIPYTRFNRGGTGHRKGMGPGRYPVKTSTYILKLLKSAHANAQQKGLDANNLLVKGAIAKQGPKTFRYGRKRGRTAKRTHVEITLLQYKPKKPELKPKVKKND